MLVEEKGFSDFCEADHWLRSRVKEEKSRRRRADRKTPISSYLVGCCVTGAIYGNRYSGLITREDIEYAARDHFYDRRRAGQLQEGAKMNNSSFTR